MSFDLKVAACSELSENEREEAAQLAAEAMSTLYEGLRDEIVAMLAREFLVEGSELGPAKAFLNNRVAGLVVSYASDEYQNRQRESLLHALRELPKTAAELMVSRMRQQATEVPKQTPRGLYLARFAVDREMRGQGVADWMISTLMSLHPRISLHVRSDNLRAASFYTRHGFEIVDETPGMFLMEWDQA